MMKTTTPFPILRIAVDLADTAEFLRATRGNLRGGWSCAGGWPALFAHRLMYLHFRRDRGDNQPASCVYFLRTDLDTLSVVGIVPDTNKISMAERQAVLHDFRSSVLESPAVRHFPVLVIEPEKVSEFNPPPEVQKVLDHWSGLLNNGAGFHPFDPTDWQYLLINLHLTKRSVSFDWLIDAFSLKHTVPERALMRLEENFYSSMDLLRHHDESLDYKREVELKRARADVCGAGSGDR